jgi:hypothetical protein
VRSGIQFSGLTVRGATLEEAFLTLTADPSASDSSTRNDFAPAGAMAKGM